MDLFERIYTLHSTLKKRRAAIPRKALAEALECSLPTLDRILKKMKVRFGAPIEFDRTAGGYRYARTPEGDSYELPGLWFTSEELQALLQQIGHLKGRWIKGTFNSEFGWTLGFYQPGGLEN